MPACKSSGGSRPPKPSGYAPASSPERPSSAMAGNGFSALRGSRVSSPSPTSPAPTVPPPATPPSAGQIPCSPMSKTASWPRTALSRPNICRATSAPSPGASTAASSSKQSTSAWPSPPPRPRQCPIACSNWLRLDGKRVTRYADDLVIGFERQADAHRFLEMMQKRFEEFALSLHPEKTRLIEFGRYAVHNRKQRGLGKPETFNFLGF